MISFKTPASSVSFCLTRASSLTSCNTETLPHTARATAFQVRSPSGTWLSRSGFANSSRTALTIKLTGVS